LVQFEVPKPVGLRREMCFQYALHVWAIYGLRVAEEE